MAMVEPTGYEEKVKALPLELDTLYIVSVNAAYGSKNTGPLRFVTRLNDIGIPDRLEYSSEMSYPWDNIFYRTRSYLKLY